MKFLPPGKKVPERFESSQFVLQPLRTTHVELDYDAVMEHPAYLRAWSQSEWPSDDFTLAENRLDLERHELEHHAGTAFTYTVLSSPGDRCLGCVYITPIGYRIAGIYFPGTKEVEPLDYSADICFWVRPSLHELDLDRRLLLALLDWFSDEWSFSRYYFHTSAETRRQQEIFEQAGLKFLADFKAKKPRPGHWFLYLLST